MIQHVTVGGEPVRLIALPAFTRKAVAAWERFVASETLFGLDVEATGIEELGAYDRSIKMRLIQFGRAPRHGEPGEAWALDPADSRWRKHITELLTNTAVRFVSHNAPFDTIRVLFEFGIDIGDRSIDTLPLAALRWPGRTAPGGKGLKALSDQYIDSGLSEADRQLHARFVDLFYASKPRKTSLLPKGFEPGVSVCRCPRKKGQEKCAEPSWEGSLCGYCEEHYLSRKTNKEIEIWGWRNIPLDDPIFLKYAGLDAVYVRRLLDLLGAEVKEMGMARLSRTEQRVRRLMTGASLRGMRVDVNWTIDVLTEIEAVFADAEEEVEALTGIKARSNYMADWFRERGVNVKSLDKDHLPALLDKYGEHPEFGPVLAGLATVSEHSNLLSNLRTIHRHATQGDGFVHPNINTMQAHTGRMSVTAPAMQTLAKKGEKGRRLRGCFLAREGHVLVGADYDSQEIRIAAALSRDPALLRIVLEGLSQHVLTAESIFPDFRDKTQDPDLYHQAKTLDFAQQYGAMPGKIAATLKISKREATVLWQKWRHTYAGYVRWADQQAKKRQVRNPFGRLIPRDPYRDYANGNYMIQSTGRDVLGEALIRLADAGWGEFFWLPIHDEMVLEVPEDRAEEAAAALTSCMTTEVRGILIPAEGEVIGPRWKGLG